MRLHQLVILSFVATISVTTVTAGGNNETEPEPRDPGTRIELGNEIEQNVERGDQFGKPVWAIVEHGIEASIEREVSNTIADGYVPVGIDYSEGGLTVLYATAPEVVFDRWILRDFSFETIDDELTAFLFDGWIPMDIAIGEDSLTVLLVRGSVLEGAIAGWRIHEVAANDLEAVFSTLEAYRDTGYTPYGIDLEDSDNEFWFLLLQFDVDAGSDPPRIAINGFPESELADGIDEDISNGLVPWGVGVGEQITFVLYLF